MSLSLSFGTTLLGAIQQNIGASLPHRFRRLSKFVIVGGSGVGVNTLVLYCLHQLVGLPVLLASALGVELAILNNYIWNDRWTFRRQRPALSRFLRFNVVSLGGLVVTTSTVWVLTTNFGTHYLVANLLGIGLATAWNFAANLHWTWGRERRVIGQPLTRSWLNQDHISA